jgi:hypothetical protein
MIPKKIIIFFRKITLITKYNYVHDQISELFHAKKSPKQLQAVMGEEEGEVVRIEKEEKNIQM